MKRTYGFTIVELLIVIVVIGILAAISIVTYNGVNDQAYDTTVKSDLSNVAKLLEMAKVDLGRYPRSTGEFPHGFKFTKSAYSTAHDGALYCANHNTDEYALGVTSKSGVRYLLTRNGVQSEGYTTAGSVCNAVGTTWSAPPVPRTAIHGFFPAGTAPSYADGWKTDWIWTN